MSKPYKKLLSAAAVGLAAIAGWQALQAQAPAQVDPDVVMPADTAIHFSLRGYGAVANEFKNTAAYASLYDSGTVDFVVPLVRRAIEQGMSGANIPKEAEPAVATMKKTLQFAFERGIVAGVSVKFLGADLIVVLPNASEGGLAAEIDARLREYIQLAGIKLKEETIEERKFSHVSILTAFGPAPRISWWTEGPHFVFAFGTSKAVDGPKRAAGKLPNLSSGNKAGRFKPAGDYARAGQVWIDIENLVGAIPNDPTVKLVLDLTDVAKMQGLNVQWGFDGKSIRADYDFLYAKQRHGFLRFLDGPSLDPAEMPKLPADVDAMFAGAVDAAHLYDTFVGTVTKIIKAVDENNLGDFTGGISAAEGYLGLKIRDDLLAPFGNAALVYQSPTDGPLGIGGISVVLGVKDRARAAKSIGRIAELIRAQDPKIVVEQKKYRGADLWIGGYSEQGFPLAPTIGLTNKWLVLGPLTPSSVMRFIRLQEGDGVPWRMPDQLATLCSGKNGIKAITYTDPKPAARTIASLIPLGAAALRNSFPRLQVDLTHMPDIEKLVQGLFPGTSVAWTDDAGLHMTSRSSIPLGGPGLTTGGAAGPVMVGLLLPAVQQAREAARRSQDMNNQKQLGLAAHNYHDVSKSMPRGTVKEGADFKVEERLSWMASILPYVEQNAAYNQLAMNQKWDSEANRKVVQQRVPMFMNPALADRPTLRAPAAAATAVEGFTPAPTHYVGLAGVGKDAATLKNDDKKAGVFGYDRETRLSDIRDGTSNTIMVMGVNQKIGPWAQGGSSTIRGLSTKPYIGGPDGFGTNGQGVNVLMCDGSVRFIANTIDPAVLEALATKAGQEIVNAP